MRIAICQLNVKQNNAIYNLKNVLRVIDCVANDGATLAILPEMFNVGFFPRKMSEEMLLEQEILSSLKRAATDLNINIIAGSIAVKRQSSFYNRMYIISSDGGIIAEYDKSHLFSGMGEQEIFTRGESRCSFSLDNVNISAGICYDLRFPSFIRKSILENSAELFVLSAQWPKVRINEFELLVRARAAENRCYIAAVNGCGQFDDTIYGGHSLLVDPNGSVLASLNEDEGYIIKDINTESVKILRENSFNVLNDINEFTD